VELALVVPLVMVLTLVTLQVALVARDQVLVVHAAREGARQAAVDPSAALVRFAALRSGSLKPEGLRAETSYQGGSGIVIVRVEYRSETAVPLIGPWFPPVQLRAKATMRSEIGHAKR